MKKIYKLNKIFNLLISLFICISFFCGCSVNKSNKTNNSDNSIQNKSSTVSLGISEKNTASSCTTILNIPATTVPSSSKTLKNNPYPTLSVPTDVTKIGDTFFIVDCYHSQIIYNNDLSAPLTEWKVLTDEESSGYKMGHTIVGDNKGLFMADDTENNRVLVFEKNKDGYIYSYFFENIGNKPHFMRYDKQNDIFYCWSSYSGELFYFKKNSDNKVILEKKHRFAEEAQTYVRSFTIEDNKIYFVSGLASSPDNKYPAAIRCYSLDDYHLIKEYQVPDKISGMVQLEHIKDYYYITVSTDTAGNQDFATIIRTTSLDLLSTEQYEDLYSQYFVGGGTPYYIGHIGNDYYLTEHRLPAHSIWKFDIDNNSKIINTNTIY